MLITKVMYETENFKLNLLGNSNDLRTNSWRVQCKKCNKYFEPSTTMFAVQILTCPYNKCDNKETVNYNKL